MKKFLSIFFISLFILTGCNKQSIDTLTEVTENFEKLNNYNIKIKFNMNDDSQNIKKILEGIIDEKNKISYFSFKSIDVDDEYITESYFDYKNELIYYTEEGKWISSSINDMLINIFDKGLLDIISKSDSVKKNNNYEIKLPFNKIYIFLGITYDYLDDYKDSEKQVTLNISIDKKTSNYSKIEIDLKDLFTEDNITTCTYTIEFSKYDEIDKIDIPTSIIENAIDGAEQSLLSIAETSAYALRKTVQFEYYGMLLDGEVINSDIVYKCTKDGCFSSGKKLELETSPSSGFITIKPDGTLIFSGIVINGYNCDIPNEGEVNCKK